MVTGMELYLKGIGIRMNLNKYYPIAEGGIYIQTPFKKNHRAKLTGEYRHPRKGEWYISGDIPETYLAKNDLPSSYYIAKIYKVYVEQKDLITDLGEVTDFNLNDLYRKYPKKYK